MIKRNAASGILSVSFIPVDQVHTFRTYNGTFALYLKYGASPEDIPFSRESSELTFDESLGGKLALSNPSQGNTREVNALVGRAGLLLCKALTGYYLFGSTQFPIYLSFSHRNSVMVGQFAGYTLAFSANVVSFSDKSYTVVAKPADPEDPEEPTDPTDPETPTTPSVEIFDTAKTSLSSLIKATSGSLTVSGVVQILTIGDNVLSVDILSKPDTGSRLSILFKDFLLDEGSYELSFTSAGDDALQLGFSLNGFATTTIQGISGVFTYAFRVPFPTQVDGVLRLSLYIDYSFFYGQIRPISYLLSDFKLVKVA